MKLNRVSRGIRLLNFLLDLVVFALIASTIIFIIKTQTHLLNTENRLTDRILSLIIYILYYFAFETIFYSTPGKLLTKTRVVNEENESPSNASILLRSILRIIPLEPFSIFFSSTKQCWHDRFSKTKIIRINH